MYGIKKSAHLFVVVVTLLAHGCPVQASVVALGLDDEMVRDWLVLAGQPMERAGSPKPAPLI